MQLVSVSASSGLPDLLVGREVGLEVGLLLDFPVRVVSEADEGMTWVGMAKLPRLPEDSPG
jgi:hypothetical protein